MNLITNPRKSVLQQKYGAGPLGLGDPDDRSLRKVEKDVLIPKKMRDKAKTEKCMDEVHQFSECCHNSGLLMSVQCRNQNSSLKQCLGKWYLNEDFRRQCTEEYLNERSEFRRTGVSLNKGDKKLPHN